jgi:hypothetical protein
MYQQHDLQQDHEAVGPRPFGRYPIQTQVEVDRGQRAQQRSEASKQAKHERDGDQHLADVHLKREESEVRQDDASYKIGVHRKRRTFYDLLDPIPEPAVGRRQLPQRLTPHHNAHRNADHPVPHVRRRALSTVPPRVDRRNKHAGHEQQPVCTGGPTWTMSQEPDRVAERIRPRGTPPWADLRAAVSNRITREPSGCGRCGRPPCPAM